MADRRVLDMDMFGYAFALFAWHRRETKPAWASHLRGDVHNAFKKGLNYLTKTGDSVFVPFGHKQPQEGEA
jgi:hypothetical protein